jgi:hypothetical protein
MIQNLHSIQKKIDDIGLGLLRFRENKLQVSIQIRAKCGKDNLIQCYCADEKNDLLKLRNKKVTLLQKSNDDYLYIAGHLEPLPGNSKTLPIRIFKACWFVRKRNGRVTWFQEKHIYHVVPQ